MTSTVVTRAGALVVDSHAMHSTAMAGAAPTAVCSQVVQQQFALRPPQLAMVMPSPALPAAPAVATANGRQRVIVG